jgi:hypothetical protein
MKSHFVFGLLSVFLLTTAHAELKWDQTTVELHPSFGDKEAVGHFKYQNTGKTPIRLTSVKTSCGCTVAKTQKDEVAPGEKGEITATFNIGNHTGIQVKTVTVQTDEPSSALLTLKAVLPEGLTLIPTFVYWKAGEEPKPKTIMAKAGKDYAATNLDVKSQNAQFSTTIEPGAGGHSWKIEVTPSQTVQNVTGTIVVKSDFPKEAPGVFYVTASVTGGPPGQPAAAAARP